MKTVPERDDRLKRIATEWVHFCRVYECPPSKNAQVDVIRHDEASSWYMRVTMRMVLFAIPCWVLITALNVFGIWFLVPALCYGILVVCVCVYWFLRHVGFDARQKREGVPVHPPQGSRLHCIGVPSELPLLAEMPSVPFESNACRAPFTVRRVVQGLLIATSFSALSNVADEFGSNILQVIFAGLAVAGLLMPLVMPVYYRVSPRRLEVLYFAPLRIAPVRVEEYDLGRAYIVADFRRNRVTIGQRNELGMNYLLWFMPDREDFVYRLFLAAISKYRPPELPHETL